MHLSTTRRLPSSNEDAIKGRIAPLTAELRALANELKQAETLPALLREIETIHRDIQEGPFRQSLPEDRQDLYTLLQTMEKSGGWPYIPRLQLRTFIDLLGQDGVEIRT
ncbi:hypothetical protein [Prochlorococcus sp. MIT 1303]|uniref:hypothetical protein n=1 Tax=Prochlorococcus sp. MIT 1303 TaxID=1723647 RepID=UPI0007B39FCB|nr:hypothetical protein [Prochlorococcus sp. MIT 1303]KZR62409.1 hypothetical protein PMIT1303_02618 [Prochlorococcus sp. MIT 1303]